MCKIKVGHMNKGKERTTLEREGGQGEASGFRKLVDINGKSVNARPHKPTSPNWETNGEEFKRMKLNQGPTYTT